MPDTERPSLLNSAGARLVSSKLLAPCLYLGVALILSWPLVTSLTNYLPQGHETSGTVQFFNLWTLSWNADRIAHGWAGYWDAPIFYGVPNTFALSEPQPLAGALFALFAWTTANPVIAYNLVVLTALSLNGIALRHLLLQVDTPIVPATVGGLLGVAIPYVWWELGVLQLIMIFPALFTFSSLLEYRRESTWVPALKTGAWIGVSFLTCGYYAIFLLLLIPVFVVPLLTRGDCSWRTLRHVSGAIALSSAIALPVVVPQYTTTSDYNRSEKTVRRFSATMVDWRRLDERSIGARTTPWLADKGGTNNRLYPGTILLVLGFFGFYLGRRGESGRSINAFALLALAAFVLSLGMRLDLAGFQPYELVREYVPGFYNLRSPFRFAAFVHIALAALAGYFIALCWRRNKPLAIALAGMAIVETAALPRQLTLFPGETVHQDWVTWLKKAPPAPLVMLPLPKKGASKNYEKTTIAMLQSLEHKKPMVGGYSGFFPKRMSQLRKELKYFPDQASIDYLRRLDVGYVVIEKGWLTRSMSRDLKGRAGFKRVFAGPDKIIYQRQKY